MEAMPQTDRFAQFFRTHSAFFTWGSGEDRGKMDIFERSHNRDQVKRLEDIADGVAAKKGQFHSVQLRHVNIVDEDGPGVRLIQSPNHIEER